MTQNIYDDDGFFSAYSRLDRSVDGLAGAAEWPALRHLVGDVQGQRVLDLGCGFGWFCRWAQENGALSVLGLDVSEKMLARARAETTHASVSYRQADLDNVSLPEGAYDLVYSSLALHYLVNLPRLFATVHQALVPGGRLIISVEHPIYTAPSRPGWHTDAEGRTYWPLDQYLMEGPRTTNWLAEGVIKQHRTIGTYVSLLLQQGFALAALEEWGPTAEQIARRGSLAIERERPPFLLIAARR